MRRTAEIPPRDHALSHFARSIRQRDRPLCDRSLPQVAEAFAHLGFPDYFRIELSLAKLLGVVVLLAPVPARLKEWAYAGFAFDIISAIIAHVAVGDGPDAWGWAIGTGVLWLLSYLLWRRLQ